MRYYRNRGWALLNSCLAIAVAAVIAVVGIRSYQGCKREAEVREIALDIQQMKVLGMKYYTAVGCALDKTQKNASYFAGNAEPSWDEVSEVTGEALHFSEGRGPWVNSYQLRVTRVEEEGDKGREQSHYHLRIEAKLKNISETQLFYIGNKLNATEIDSKQMRLAWDELAFMLRGSLGKRYQPLQVSRLSGLQRVDQDGFALQANRQYCR